MSTPAVAPKGSAPQVARDLPAASEAKIEELRLLFSKRLCSSFGINTADVYVHAVEELERGRCLKDSTQGYSYLVKTAEDNQGILNPDQEFTYQPYLDSLKQTLDAKKATGVFDDDVPAGQEEGVYSSGVEDEAATQTK